MSETRTDDVRAYTMSFAFKVADRVLRSLRRRRDVEGMATDDIYAALLIATGNKLVRECGWEPERVASMALDAARSAKQQH